MRRTLSFRDLPFELSGNQVLYVENAYNEKINKIIRDNYETIVKTFRVYRLDFCYLPKITQTIQTTPYLLYHKPFDKDLRIISNPNVINLLDYLSDKQEKDSLTPSLIYYCYDDSDTETETILGCTSIESYDYKDIALCFDEIAHKIYDERLSADHRIRFHRRLGDLPKNADEGFDFEVLHLMDEIEERVEKLRQKGVVAYMIDNLLHSNEILSDMLITKDKRIILTDYNNMEITMYPLPKAVFFLFLRHEEGILFKNLIDYREELGEIYAQIKGPLNTKDKQSIKDLTNPLKNSINEKCARVRESFISRFDDYLAKYYYINGKKGEEKKILLPRDMVKWE